jgi:hypothetical protein
MAKPGSPEAKAIEDELSMYRQLEAQQNYIMSNRQQSISQMKASLYSWLWGNAFWHDASAVRAPKLT